MAMPFGDRIHGRSHDLLQVDEGALYRLSVALSFVVFFPPNGVPPKTIGGATSTELRLPGANIFNRSANLGHVSRPQSGSS